MLVESSVMEQRSEAVLAVALPAQRDPGGSRRGRSAARDTVAAPSAALLSFSGWAATTHFT